MIAFPMAFERAIPALVAELDRRADEKGGVAFLGETKDLEPALCTRLVEVSS
jgi:hypothetical protein